MKSKTRQTAGFFAGNFCSIYEKCLVFQSLLEIHYKRMKKLKQKRDLCRLMFSKRETERIGQERGILQFVRHPGHIQASSKVCL